MKNSLKRQSRNQNPGSGMAEILDLPEWEFAITMIIILTALLKKWKTCEN